MAVPTFQEAATKTYEVMKPRWRNEKVTANWWQQMQLHAFGRLGSMLVTKIQREDVLAVLVPLWTSRPETGRRIRRNIKVVLGWCQAHGFITVNFAGDQIDGALPRLAKVKQHFRALPYSQVSAALDTIEHSKASLVSKLCLRMVVLTAVRSGEARLATWSEMDMEKRTWVIPVARMKGGIEHRIPLSDAVMDLLEQAKALKHDDDLVFPSPKKPNSPLSDMALTKVLRDTGLAEKTVVHGFRSAVSGIGVRRLAKPREVAEAALAHIVGGVEGAYFRSRLVCQTSWSTDGGMGAVFGRGRRKGGAVTRIRA